MPQFGAQIDTLRIPVKGLTPEQGTSFPGTPTEGLMFHRTDLKQAFIYLNAQWVQIDNVTGGTASNVTDGDKGVITVTGGVWALDANTVTQTQIANGAVVGSKIAAGAVDNVNIAAGAISGGVGGVIADGTISTVDIGDSQITSAKIADGTIVDADISASAAIATSKIAGLDTALTGKVPTSRQVIAGNGLAGGGALTADVTVNVGAGTGITVNADDIAVNRTTVDAWYVDVGGDTMTGFLTLNADPSQALHAATKQYVDTTAQGLDTKLSVKAASTAAGGNLTLSGAQTIDGIALVAGDRVLVKNQTTPAQNGLYVVASGAWTRTTDMDAWTEVPGAFVFVEQGTTQADTGWVSTADQGGTIGSTAITWTQFSGAGTVTAGTGIIVTGNQVSIDDAVVATDAQVASAVAVKADKTTTISTTAPLTGGGDLSANRTLGISNFTSGAAGAVPSGGSNSTFLRGDATWQTIPDQTANDARYWNATGDTVTGIYQIGSGAGNGIRIVDQVQNLDSAMMSDRYAFYDSTITSYYGGIQCDQQNKFVTLSAPIATWTLRLSAPSITVSQNPANANEVANKAYVDAQVGAKVARFAGDIPAMTAGAEQTITHNLNSFDVQVGFVRKTAIAAGPGAGGSIELTWRAITLNTIGVTADLPAGFAANEIRCTVMA